MTRHFDDLEIRSPEERANTIEQCLPAQIATAAGLPGYAELLADIKAEDVTSREALASLPILRKSTLGEAQGALPPLGGFTVPSPSGFAYLFQSPGPLYEPGQSGNDWWRLGRFLHAAGIGCGDIVQNCFGYHLTPAGHMFEDGARAVGATVIPAGTGQTELQVQAASHLGATAYAGTPDYLNTLFDKAEELGRSLKITKATVSGGALFPSLREAYAVRGVTCLQCYATADVGLIAYEVPNPSGALPEGMIVDEGVLIEIVTPGTGDPVPEGEVGEVIVTSLNPDYPLIRFATGDLSAVLPGQSACGRTNLRLKGWMGRADQTTKVKGMFVRPEQVAALVARFPEADRARITVTRDGEQDAMLVQIEGDAGGLDVAALEAAVRDILKLTGRVECTSPGSLPRDGKVIDDKRSYD